MSCVRLRRSRVACLLLPIAVLPLAIPAGYPGSQFSEPRPVWLGQLVLIPFEILLIAAGLACGPS